MRDVVAQSRWRLTIIASAIALAAALPYLPSVNHGFLTYDDPLYVTNNAMVQRGLTWEGLRWSFSTFHACNWHPLTWLSHMTDVQLFGLSPSGPHAVNLILHALNSVLVWLMLRLLTGSVWRSAAVAAVFAVHPQHVESVAWISERKDLLSTMFGVLAIGAYAKWVRSRRTVWYAALVACFALSLLSKPMLVTLPFLLLVLDFWPLRRWQERPPAARTAGKRGQASRSATSIAELRRSLVEKTPLVLMSAVSCVITVIAQESGDAVRPLTEMPLTSRVANAVVSYASYIEKFVWPVDLAAFYPRSNRIDAAAIAISVAVIGSVTMAAILLRRRHPALLTGWLWFLGTLVPVIGLVQVGMQAMADRYMYVPMIGLLIMVCWSVPWPKLRAAQFGLVSLIGIVVGALGWRTSEQVKPWKDSVALFEHALNAAPDNHVTRCNLGNALLEAERPNEAIDQLKASLALHDGVPLTHYDIGIAYQVTGRYEDAERHYRRAIALASGYAEAYANLGGTLVSLRRLEEAIAASQRAIELDPTLGEGYANLGLALASMQRPAQAIPHLERAVALKPRSSKTRVNLAVCLDSMNRPAEAIDHLRVAIADDPDLIEARLVLAKYLDRDNKLGEALDHLKHADQLRPNTPEIRARIEQLQRRLQSEPGHG